MKLDEILKENRNINKVNIFYDVACNLEAQLEVPKYLTK